MTPDVVVIGAGPGGSAAAALLAEAGREVLLVDRAAFPRPKTCGDALSPRAMAVLERLDCPLPQSEFQRIHGGRLIAPNGKALDVDFADTFRDLPPVGRVIPRLTLDDWLCRHAVRRGARLWQGVSATSVELDGDRIAQVVLQGEEGERKVGARAVLIATGAAVGLLKGLGLLRRMPPVMRAARAYYEGVGGLDGRCEFFFPAELLPGYAWAFPVRGQMANVGVVITPGSRTPVSNPAAALRRFETEMAMPGWLQGARRVSPIQGYPIRTDFPSHRVHGANWLLIGEAAGLVNPITGEGIDLAMESGMLAAEVIDAALRSGGGSAEGLRRYESELHRRYASYFRGSRWLQRLVLSPPWLVNRLIGQARDHRDLADTLATVALGVASPSRFLRPRVWRQILWRDVGRGRKSGR